MNLKNYISFLGIAEYVKQGFQAYPFGNLDIFQLSKYKIHIIYPALTLNHHCVFMISSDLLKVENFEAMEINIIDEEEKIIGSGKFEVKGTENLNTPPRSDAKVIYVKYDETSLLIYFKLNSNIEKPGIYKIIAKIHDHIETIDSVHFLYSQAPPLASEEILALESNPNAIKTFIMHLGCKYCNKKLKVYTALRRMNELENDGLIYQYDLKGKFVCDCGKTNYDLKYLQESMHGMLRKNLSKESIGVNYIRMYAHNQIINIISEFDKLVTEEKDEDVYQHYIENNLLLLAKYHAQNIFIKPDILGKFEPDFAILDSANVLKLIELEKPSLKLFTKNRQPRHKLIHAFGQVVDWLNEYKKNPDTFLECFELNRDKIATIKGVVIAGNSNKEDFKNLQRFYSNPTYPDIELITVDELSKSLLEISKKLV